MDPQLEDYEDLHEKLFLAIQPSLEHLAARTVTISLLQNTINQLRVEDNFFSETCTISLAQCVKTLRVPENCENKLFILLKKIYHQIRLGFFLVYQRNFSENPSTLENYQSYVYLKNIVWTSNGTINLGETAKSIIKSGLLTDEERYTIACRYCITEAVYELAPRVVNQRYLDKVDACFDPLIFFWSCWTAGQMHRLKRFPLVLYAYLHIQMDWRAFMQNSMSWDLNLLLLPVTDFRQVLLMDHYHELLEMSMVKETSFRYFWKRMPKAKRYRVLGKAWYLDLDVEDQRNQYSENSFHGRYITEHLLLPQLSLILRYFLEKMEEFWVHVAQPLRESAIETTFTNQFAELKRPLYRRTQDHLVEVVFQNADEASKRRVSNSKYGKHERCMHRTWSTEGFEGERLQFEVQQRQNFEEPAENERCTRIVIERDAELGNGCSADANSRNLGTNAGLCEAVFEYFIVVVIFCTTFLVLPIAVTGVVAYCFSGGIVKLSFYE